MLDVIVLTDLRYQNPDLTDPFIRDLIYEDELLRIALKKIGLKTKRVAWDDPNFNWESARCAIFRSTWNYIDHFEKFINWIDQISDKIKLINNDKMIKWNSDKHYLIELNQKGIPIAPTEFLPVNCGKTLSNIHENKSWHKSVLKPVVSGGGKHTYKVDGNNIHQIDDKLKVLNQTESYMLQSFQENIVSKGEISLIMIDGQFTHGILKKAKAGDFRVQSDFGGVFEIYHPTPEELKFAEHAIQACATLPIYARVDIFYDNDDQIALAELELIEPELWFRLFPKAADLLAQKIKKTIAV